MTPNAPYRNRGSGPQQAHHQQQLRAIPTPENQPHPYHGAAGNLDPFWVDDGAEKEAEAFRALPPTQLRRFFSEVKGLQRQLDLLASQERGERRLPREAAWAQIHPQFAMLKSKVVYAQGRIGAKNMPDAFVRFVINHVAWVKDVGDFDAFLAHFEAVVGFHRYLTTAKG